MGIGAEGEEGKERLREGGTAVELHGGGEGEGLGRGECGKREGGEVYCMFGHQNRTGES